MQGQCLLNLRCGHDFLQCWLHKYRFEARLSSELWCSLAASLAGCFGRTLLAKKKMKKMMRVEMQTKSPPVQQSLEVALPLASDVPISDKHVRYPIKAASINYICLISLEAVTLVLYELRRGLSQLQLASGVIRAPLFATLRNNAINEGEGPRHVLRLHATDVREGVTIQLNSALSNTALAS
eukprot:6060510-Amphidinium_carterae.1